MVQLEVAEIVSFKWLNLEVDSASIKIYNIVNYY